MLIQQGRNFAIPTVRGLEHAAGLATAQHDACLSCTSFSIYFLRSLISLLASFTSFCFFILAGKAQSI
jgi:hypothetical protein